MLPSCATARRLSDPSASARGPRGLSPGRRSYSSPVERSDASCPMLDAPTTAQTAAATKALIRALANYADIVTIKTHFDVRAGRRC